MHGWKQRWAFFVHLGTHPTSLCKCPPCSSSPSYSWLRCDCFNAQKCGWCNYHLHKQDSSFIDLLPLIRQELGSETMAEATRGSPAPGTWDRPASSVNADDQQRRPVIHRTLAFLINFHSALLGVLVWWCWPPDLLMNVAFSSALAVRRSALQAPRAGAPFSVQDVYVWICVRGRDASSLRLV